MEVVPITEEHFAEINIDELKSLAEKYKKQQIRRDCQAARDRHKRQQATTNIDQ